MTLFIELLGMYGCFFCKVLKLRTLGKAQLDLTGDLPGFSAATAHIRAEPEWRVSPVPARLQCRHVDIGDLAPCDTGRFLLALQSPAQGIQVQRYLKLTN